MSDLRFVGCLVVGWVLVLFLVGGCVVSYNAVVCDQLGLQTGHPTRWVLLGGGDDACLIYIDGEWIPTSNWLVNSGN